MLADEAFELAFAFSKVKGTEDAVALSLNTIYFDNDKAVPFMEAVISEEVQRVKYSGTMFRANSFTSQLFKHFAITSAAPCLWEMLAPFVWDIMQEAKALSEEEEEDVEMSLRGSRSTIGAKKDMEVDPTKMDEAADPKVNTLELWLTAQKIFSCIARSHNELPAELGEILKCVHNMVEKRFPGEEYKAMGGFLFLRFVCPALLAPLYFGVADENPNPMAQRQLILVAKVLQNLTNDTLPGIKEAYMQALNEFYQ